MTKDDSAALRNDFSRDFGALLSELVARNIRDMSATVRGAKATGADAAAAGADASAPGDATGPDASGQE